MWQSNFIYRIHAKPPLSMSLGYRGADRATSLPRDICLIGRFVSASPRLIQSEPRYGLTTGRTDLEVVTLWARGPPYPVGWQVVSVIFVLTIPTVAHEHVATTSCIDVPEAQSGRQWQCALLRSRATLTVIFLEQTNPPCATSERTRAAMTQREVATHCLVRTKQITCDE